MQIEELWIIYVEKNPKFAEPEAQITFTQRGLRKFFEQTWNAAHKQGFENGKAWAEMQPKASGKSDSFGDIFGGMFGKK